MSMARVTSFWRIWAIMIAAFVVSGPVLAANRVVVIPLNSGKGKPLAQVVTVSPKNGDFKDPVAALNSITDASSSKPYVIVIGPGRYSLNRTVAMKSWVSIYGAGREATILSFSGVETAITGADNCELADLTVDLNGSGLNNSTGMDNSAATPRIRNVRIHVHNGTNMYGLYGAFAMTEPTLKDVNIEINGNNSSSAYGIYNYGGGWSLVDVQISVNIQSGTGVGFSCTGGVDTIVRSAITINGTGAASEVTGIEVKDSGTIVIQQSTITVDGAVMVYGLYSKNARSVTVTGTELDIRGSDGSAHGMFIEGNTETTLRHSEITTSSVSGAARGLRVSTGVQLKASQITLAAKGKTTAIGFMSEGAGSFHLDDSTIAVQADSSSTANGIDVSGGTYDQVIRSCSVLSSDTGIYGFSGTQLEVYNSLISSYRYGVFSHQSYVSINNCKVSAFAMHSLVSNGSSSNIEARFTTLQDTVQSLNSGQLHCYMTIKHNGTVFTPSCQ